MTDAELDIICARVEAVRQMNGNLAMRAARGVTTIDVPALVAEVRRQREAMRAALKAEDAADMHHAIQEALNR